MAVIGEDRRTVVSDLLVGHRVRKVGTEVREGTTMGLVGYVGSAAASVLASRNVAAALLASFITASRSALGKMGEAMSITCLARAEAPVGRVARSSRVVVRLVGE